MSWWQPKLEVQLLQVSERKNLVLRRFWDSWMVPKVFFEQIPDVVEFAAVFGVVFAVGMG
jgi:hypothetical protein